MRRADRLFQIVRTLRGGRLQTAQALAQRLEVSVRTVYRDVRDLQASGMPIEGEAGVGYTLRRDLDLPPLMFTRSELTALVLGARLVQAWGGAESAIAAAQALQRIEGVLPPDLRERLDSILMYAPGGFHMRPHLRERLDLLHEACISRRVIAFAYTREDGAPSQRDVRPLALYFWSGVWTLASWCELRQDFRVFRMDRIEDLRVLDREFTPKRGQRLEDFVRIVERQRAEATADWVNKNGERQSA
jgi:predicted DNA-binding transcriptional regulator YafY